ncbi:hypothetical protein QAD02_014385, partial [Eretmocerus hayati]
IKYHRMPQGSLQCQGTQRRAYAPGANWNVQVVRSKTTTRCLWHACKALGIGLLLMFLGACMATIGYYADQLSVAQEIRGNLTVRVKDESRGIHLNNLSYAGPIIMGVGGFIVVAACVMTFEARDSAAKVVPARFRFNQGSTLKNTKQSQRNNRKSTSSQTSKWDHQLGLFRCNRSPSPSLRDASRRQLTAELVQFSKNLEDKGVTGQMRKSPSAPSLVEKRSPRRRSPKYGAGCALLNPELLKRYAASVDVPGYNPQQIVRENIDLQKLNGSQASMAMDLHIPNKGPVTLRIKDRSDTAKRHQLARQTKIEDAEDLEEAKRTAALNRSFSPKLSGPYTIRYPDDFVPKKRNSIDIRILEGLQLKDLALKTSPRDSRKISSSNCGKILLERMASERKADKSLSRKASFDFKRSPDFKRTDYRKYSIERFTADCAKYTPNELEDGYRGGSGENLQRKSRHPKLHHSRSDDSRRRSFDRYRSDPRSSRHSLNTQVADKAGPRDYELKYLVHTAATSLDTEESRSDCESFVTHEYDEANPASIGLSEGAMDADALLEEPELEDDMENLTKSPNEIREAAPYAKQETLSPDETMMDSKIDTAQEGRDVQEDEHRVQLGEEEEGKSEIAANDVVIDVGDE